MLRGGPEIHPPHHQRWSIPKRIYAILQDRRGFMWFATRDGLNRYDGNTFVVYKNNPEDPDSLGANEYRI